MKSAITIVFCLTTLISVSQGDTGRFGCAVNMSYWNGYYNSSIVPAATYFVKKHQFELGLGIHPFTSDNVRILSPEFNYKYFPNGIENRFNMYLTTNFTYSNVLVRQGFNVRNNLLFLNGGYGFEIKFVKSAFIGTNANLGFYTQSRSSEDPNYIFNKELFDDFTLSALIRINIGYRFN